MTTNAPFLRPHSESDYDYMDNDELPDWPSEIAFNDRKRFHMVITKDTHSLVVSFFLFHLCVLLLPSSDILCFINKPCR